MKRVLLSAMVVVYLAFGLALDRVHAHEPDWFVDVNVPEGGSGDGSSWADAFSDLETRDSHPF